MQKAMDKLEVPLSKR